MGQAMSQWGGCFGTVKYKTVKIMYMYNKNTPIKSIPRTESRRTII